MKYIGWATTFFAVYAASSLWSGYVLSCLWGWFIAPTFAVKQLAVAEAVGIMVIGHFLLPRGDVKSKDGFTVWFKGILPHLASYPAMALLIGWGWKFFL